MKNEFSCFSYLFIHVWFEPYWLFSWKYYLHDYWTLTLHLFCHDLVSWTPFWALSFLSVNSCVFSMIHEIHMFWFHVFEGSLTSFSKIILTSYCSSFGSVFTIIIFSNTYFWKPLPTPFLGGRMGEYAL